MKILRCLPLTTIVLLLPTPAFAHHLMGGEPPATFAQGLLSGLAHPVLGLDHFLFLLMAGALTGSLEATARYRMAALFVVSGLLGTSVHLAAIDLPGAEALIAISVIVGGALVRSSRRPGVAPLAGLFAVAGVLHGYAYAESVVGVENAPLLAYLGGLVVIQCAVVGGVAFALDASGDRSSPIPPILIEAGARPSRMRRGVASGVRLAGGLAIGGGALFLALSLV
jgi:urease accessory protein